MEDAILKDTVEAYNRRMKEFEEHTKARSRQLAAFMGHHQVRKHLWASYRHIGFAGSFLKLLGLKGFLPGTKLA